MTEEFVGLWVDAHMEERNNRTAETRDNKAFLALVAYANAQLAK